MSIMGKNSKGNDVERKSEIVRDYGVIIKGESLDGHYIEYSAILQENGDKKLLILWTKEFGPWTFPKMIDHTFEKSEIDQLLNIFDDAVNLL